MSAEGNLRPRRPPREYLGEYTSRGKPKIPPADRILMDPGHKARKNPSDNADLGFQFLRIREEENRCRDMDELINFEPDPDHSPDAGTELLSLISYVV